MVACSGTHYLAKEFTKLGNDMRIMASKFVIPYRKMILMLFAKHRQDLKLVFLYQK